MKALLVIIAAAAAALFFDVAKPYTQAEEIHYGLWYLDNYGLGESGNIKAIDHLKWRVYNLVN